VSRDNAHASARIEFNSDWHFHTDPKNNGEQQPWFDRESSSRTG